MELSMGQMGIYIGSRGNNFKEMIEKLLQRADMNKKYLDVLLSREAMEIYDAVFTSDSVNENHNYQVYEQLGDMTCNKFIVQYMYERFPQLRCAQGVKVVARLRINYGAKNSFAEIGRKLGFWDYITCHQSLREKYMKSLLEDVFEAFIGAIEYLIDKKIRYGLGYAMVSNILKSLFDEIEISLLYEDLYDAKTRLKELFDSIGNLGVLKYTDERVGASTIVRIYRVENHQQILIGEGRSAVKSSSQQLAAENALSRLEREGYRKEPPAIYKRFNSNYKLPAITKETLGEDKVNINELKNWGGKSKYYNQYKCTLLSYYCKTRRYSGIVTCLELGGDPNILDSDGISCIELLFIGNINEQVVKKCISKLEEYGGGGRVEIHKDIYTMYILGYTIDPFYVEFNKRIKIKN